VGKLVNMRPEARGAEAKADLDLVEACRRGDRQALHTVFTAQAPYLERLLRRIVGRSCEVEDLLQSTFVAAIRAFPGFRGEAQVRTWLARIAIRTAQERLRRADHRRRGELPSFEEVHDDSGREEHREHDLDTRRRLDRLYAHLEAIGPKKRVAFVLHVLEGHPMDEVAALTGATLTATKSRVFWARRELLRRAARDPMLRDLVAVGGGR
jgi:RNA polymerase sigma-70 factor, ECF subfamily